MCSSDLDEGEGGTLNAERRTLNAEVGRHGEEGSRLVAPDVRAGTGVEVVQAVIEVEKAGSGGDAVGTQAGGAAARGALNGLSGEAARVTSSGRQEELGQDAHATLYLQSATLLRPPSSVLRQRVRRPQNVQ